MQELCKLGRPIDSARIMKYEKLYHFMVIKHFKSMKFPPGFGYDDLINMCRFEAVKAFRKLDPSKIPAHSKSKRKTSSKLQKSPEDQVEFNLVYYQVDWLLKRFKHHYGIRTAAGIRRGRSVSLDLIIQNQRELLEDVYADALDIEKFSFSILSEEKKKEVEEHYSHMKWLIARRRCGAKSVREYLNNLPEQTRTLVEEYAIWAAKQISTVRPNPIKETEFNQEVDNGSEALVS